MKRAIILGAGISGLALAWHLRKKNPEIDICIVDPQKRAGGWIETRCIDAYQFECGPRSLRFCQSDLNFINEIGLSSELIEADSQAAKKYLVFDGKLIAVPPNPLALLTSPFGHLCMKAVFGYPFRRKAKCDDESVASFFEKRLGRGAMRAIIDPVVGGIWAAKPDAISMKASFSALPKRSKMKLYSFRNGVEELPKKLATHFAKNLHLGVVPKKIVELSDRVVLECQNETFEGDVLFSTLTVEKGAALLQGDRVLPLLPHVPRTSLVVVALGWKKEDLPFHGFGFLCPSQEEGGKLLGISFDSSIFPQHNGPFASRLSVMIGGRGDESFCEKSDDELQSLATRYCKKYLGLGVPDVAHIVRAKRSISAYLIGHMQRLSTLEAHLAPRRIKMVGAGLYGISVPACIQQSQKIGMCS